MTEPQPWVRDEGFELLCRRLLEVFPAAAPNVVVDEGDGDLGKAQHAFRLHGSHWSCSAIFENRSIICFVNAEAFLFLLPRFISCSLAESGLNGDIYDYVLFGLEHRLAEFSTLFSLGQRAALIAPLQYLLGGMVLNYGLSDRQLETTRRILRALRA